jgi:hypothetical protein
MPTTYKAIATVTVGSGGAANIQFTSIPQTYTDLILKVSVRSNGATTFTGGNVAFNGSTANFTSRFLYGTGSSATSITSTNQLASMNAAQTTSSVFANGSIYIPNYTGSNYKSYSTDVVTENNDPFAIAYFITGLWSNTSSITSITYTPDSGSFVQYSTATLYGIKNS